VYSPFLRVLINAFLRSNVLKKENLKSRDNCIFLLLVGNFLRVLKNAFLSFNVLKKRI